MANSFENDDLWIELTLHWRRAIKLFGRMVAVRLEHSAPKTRSSPNTEQDYLEAAGGRGNSTFQLTFSVDATKADFCRYTRISRS